MRASVITACLGLLALAAGAGVIWQAAEATSLRRDISSLGESATELGRMRLEHRRLRAQLEAKAKREQASVSRSHLVPPRVEAIVSPAVVSPTLRTEVEERYSPFFARLTLPPDTRRAVTNCIAARCANLAEQSRAATLAGRSPYAPELLERAYETQVRLGAQLETEFGHGVAEAYRRFEWELAARNVVVIATQRLASASTPLTEEQRRRLFALLLQHAGPGLPGDVTLGDFLPPHSQSIEITERIVQAAAPWLLPAQLAMLETFRTSQWKMAR